MFIKEILTEAQTLFEGGNVFKNNKGEPLTVRINKADVPSTIKWLEKITKIDLTGKEKDEGNVPRYWLGSTGRGETSGDLDLTVLVSDATKEQLVAKLVAWLKASGIPDSDIFNKGKGKNDGWIKVAADVHFRTPINGNPKNGFVQTDFNFFTDPKARDYATFYLSGTSPNFKGMYRNIFASSLAKLAGLKFTINGLQDRNTNMVVKNGFNPDYIAKAILQNKNATRKDIATVENILKALKTDPKRNEKVAAFAQEAESKGLPFKQVLNSIWNEKGKK